MWLFAHFVVFAHFTAPHHYLPEPISIRTTIPTRTNIYLPGPCTINQEYYQRGPYGYLPGPLTTRNDTNQNNSQLRTRRALLQIKDVPLRTRRALLPLTLYSNSALLVLNGTSLSCNNALLALN